MKERVISVFVFVSSFLLFIGVAYVFVVDLDFFLNKKVSSGNLKILKEGRNKIEFSVNYYDEYQKRNLRRIKKIEISYRGKIKKLETSSVSVLYGKWFNQFYISELKKPRVFILLLEALMMSLFYFGMKSGWKNG